MFQAFVRKFLKTGHFPRVLRVSNLLATRLLNTDRLRMKAIMILGAIVGFAIGAGFGLAGKAPWPTALGHASVAALFAAVLARWWSRVWLNGLNDSLQHHRTAPKQPDAAKAATKV